MVHKMLNDKKMKHDQTVNKLNGILGVIKQKGRVLIDEADTILNCKNEVNFTMGDSIKPPDSELKLLAILHRKLLGVMMGITQTI